MKNVLIATEKPFSSAAVNEIRTLIEGAGYQLNLLEKYTDKADLLDAAQNAHALIIRSDKIDAEVMDAAPELKIVVRAGAGYDNVDLEAATARDITVMNTPGQNANAVAELAMGMMVFLNRNGFNPKAGSELRGKKIGIHAYGYVGKLVGEIARGFGMEVYAFDPFIEQSVITGDGVTAVGSVEELYASCEYISLHIPANDHTRESINEELLSRMPVGATLVNTARKEVIDEAGLARLMEKRADFRYISDIAPGNREELENRFGDRCFFTPKKMGAQTAEANLNAGVAAANQIIAFLEKGDATFKVN